MFAPDFYIDSFQSTKRILTNQIYKDETLNKAAHAFIDAQTAFAKMLTKNSLDLTAYSVNALSAYFFPKTPVKVEEVNTTTAKAKAVKKAKVAEEADTDINTQGE